MIFNLSVSSNRYVVGADEGTRTPTPLALVPKTSASTSSATSAYLLNNVYNSIIILTLSSNFSHFYLLKNNINPPIIAIIKPNILRP